MSAPLSHEKRKSKRHQILEQFSFYVSVPKLGATKLKVHDISETGIGFSVDTLGHFKLAPHENVDLNFYLNQSLFLPLKIQVVRQIENDEQQHLGAVFLETQASQYKTFLTLVQFIDQLVDAGLVDHQ